MPTTTTTILDPLLSGSVVHQNIGTQINHPGLSNNVVIALMCCITAVAMLAVYLKNQSRK